MIGSKFFNKTFAGGTVKNTVISPNAVKFCGSFVERHSFCIVLGQLHKTMCKVCLSTKFPHQEIRWNYGVFCSVGKKFFDTCFYVFKCFIVSCLSTVWSVFYVLVSIIKYLCILHSRSEIDFKFRLNVFREKLILIWSHDWCMFYRPGYKYFTDWCVN